MHVMYDGYFKTPGRPNDATWIELLQPIPNLSLTCRESRQAVVQLYPSIVTLYTSCAGFNNDLATIVLRYSATADIFEIARIQGRADNRSLDARQPPSAVSPSRIREFRHFLESIQTIVVSPTPYCRRRNGSQLGFGPMVLLIMYMHSVRQVYLRPEHQGGVQYSEANVWIDDIGEMTTESAIRVAKLHNAEWDPPWKKSAHLYDLRPQARYFRREIIRQSAYADRVRAGTDEWVPSSREPPSVGFCASIRRAPETDEEDPCFKTTAMTESDNELLGSEEQDRQAWNQTGNFAPFPVPAPVPAPPRRSGRIRNQPDNGSGIT